jgi:hypothetical protein
MIVKFQYFLVKSKSANHNSLPDLILISYGLIYVLNEIQIMEAYTYSQLLISFNLSCAHFWHSIHTYMDRRTETAALFCIGI